MHGSDEADLYNTLVDPLCWGQAELASYCYEYDYSVNCVFKYTFQFVLLYLHTQYMCTPGTTYIVIVGMSSYIQL